MHNLPTIPSPVHRTVTVPLSLEQAFDLFANRMSEWWPAANTFGKDEYHSVTVEPHSGGRWYERSDAGQETAWGRVLAWEPPQRIVLTWQITPQGQPEPDSEKASEVEVTFFFAGQANTRVELEHRAFERHGLPGAAIWRTGMASLQGWDQLLEKYARAAEKEAG